MRDLYSLSHGAEGHILGTPPGAWACVCVCVFVAQPSSAPSAFCVPHSLGCVQVSESGRRGGAGMPSGATAPALPRDRLGFGGQAHIQSSSKWRPVRCARGLDHSLPFGLWPPSQLSWALILAAGLAPDGGAVAYRGEGEHQGAGMREEQQCAGETLSGAPTSSAPGPSLNSSTQPLSSASFPDLTLIPSVLMNSVFFWGSSPGLLICCLFDFGRSLRAYPGFVLRAHAWQDLGPYEVLGPHWVGFTQAKCPPHCAEFRPRMSS